MYFGEIHKASILIQCWLTKFCYFLGVLEAGIDLAKMFRCIQKMSWLRYIVVRALKSLDVLTTNR
jgi:hypothetical protein